MTKRKSSLKWSLIYYVPFCMIMAFVGTYAIGFGTNDLQVWYSDRYLDLDLSPNVSYYFYTDEEGREHEEYVLPATRRDGKQPNADNMQYFVTYWLISNAQTVLIPLWVVMCIVLTGTIFYNRELRKPIEILSNASRKIANNELDFKIEYKKQDELGNLCAAFDEMRSALYENNREMWRSLEERKRLNAAFSHDLRTPLTVLKGYADFLEKYVPDKKVSEEKLLSILSMMNSQITRLENYTRQMNTAQKLEDIVPKAELIPVKKLFSQLAETGEFLCGGKFSIETSIGHSTKGSVDCETISADMDLVMQIYENLLSNAVRYAQGSVEVQCSVSGGLLTLTVRDDGGGFAENILKNATDPFFRGEKEPDQSHFGLGLYICRILCEKCGGKLSVQNWEKGGEVKAELLSISSSK